MYDLDDYVVFVVQQYWFGDYFGFVVFGDWFQFQVFGDLQLFFDVIDVVGRSVDELFDIFVYGFVGQLYCGQCVDFLGQFGIEIVVGIVGD